MGFAFWLVSALLVPAVPDSCFGVSAFGPGSRWVYQGTRSWSGPEASSVDSGMVRWTTSVIARRQLGRATLLLVRGWVSELAWSDPTTTPRLSVLACTGNRLFHLEPGPDTSATDLFQRWPTDATARGELILEEPFKDGTVFAQDSGRIDGMYGWAVVRPDYPTRLPRSCRASSRDEFELTLRTLPDHQVVHWVRGVGVVSYVYGHHGTPAAARVSLVGCSIKLAS